MTTHGDRMLRYMVCVTRTADSPRIRGAVDYELQLDNTRCCGNQVFVARSTESGARGDGRNVDQSGKQIQVFVTESP
jgi:hypothetical protein